MSTGESPRTSALATLALLSVTATWGSTFFLIKDLLDRVPVADFLAVRFTVAAAALFLVAPRAVARLSPLARRRGVVLGLVYGAAQLLQTAGLGHTSASVSGFVTGMYVVMTPLFAGVAVPDPGRPYGVDRRRAGHGRAGIAVPAGAGVRPR
jgi:drug/metabolite transporter (DMT)-like permease